MFFQEKKTIQEKVYIKTHLLQNQQKWIRIEEKKKFQLLLIASSKHLFHAICRLFFVNFIYLSFYNIVLIIFSGLNKVLDSNGFVNGGLLPQLFLLSGGLVMCREGLSAPALMVQLKLVKFKTLNAELHVCFLYSKVVFTYFNEILE